MIFNLTYLLEHLGMYNVLKHHNPDRSVNYVCCKWLGNKENDFTEDCIYVGYSSQLSAAIPKNKVGIIVVNDTGADYSNSEVDFVELDPATDPLQLCLLIKEVFFKSYEVSNISKELIIRMLKPAGVKEIVDLIGDYLGNPVFLNFHYFGRIFFYTGDAVTVNEVKTLLAVKAAPPEQRTTQMVNDIRSSPHPTIHDDGFCFKGHRRMQTTIFQGIGSENPCAILTVFEVNRKFTDNDNAFLSFMAYLLSMKASDPGFEAQLTGCKNEQLLHDLIRGASIEATPEVFSSMFGTLFANYHLFLIDTKNLSSYTADNIKFTLLRHCHFSTCLMRGSYLVFIANISPQERTQVFSAAAELADKFSLAIGVSEQFSDIYRLKKFYTQAKRAREAGITMKCSHGVFKFEDIKDEILVADLSAMESMELYVNEAFDRLAEHDRENDTEYCKTLREYILCGMDNAKTLQKLSIHRNTLSYRLNRIEEICGKSLNDGRFLVSMYFSGIIRSIPANERRIEDE